MKAGKVNDNDKDAVASVGEKRRKLVAGIKLFRAQQRRHMPFVAELLEGEDSEDEGSENGSAEVAPEDEPLMLPSWFSLAERQEHELPPELAEIERSLREAHAESVLSNLRFSIRTFGVSADEEKQQFDSARDKPRARAALKKMKSKQLTYVAMYQGHYEALLGLGMAASDRRYRPLDRSMLSAHQPTDKPQALGRGKGGKEEAWFWRGEMDVGTVSKKEKEQLGKLTDDGACVTYQGCSTDLLWDRKPREVFPPSRTAQALGRAARHRWSRIRSHRATLQAHGGDLAGACTDRRREGPAVR